MKKKDTITLAADKNHKEWGLPTFEVFKRLTTPLSAKDKEENN